METADLEKVIRRILEEEGEGEDLPPPPHLFDRIIRNLEIRRGRKRLQLLACKAALSLALVLVFSTTLVALFPAQMSEGRRKLMATITHIITGHIHIDAEDPHPLLACFDEEALEEFRLLEARLPFPVKLPGYVPPRYRVTRALLEDEVFTLHFARGRESFILLQGPGVEIPRPGRGGAVEIPGQGVCPLPVEGRQAMGFRDEEGVGFLLVGDPRANTIRKIRASLR